MVSILKRYQQRLEHTHGWAVPLTCTHCGHEGLPRYDGWTPSTVVRFGGKPTIYANVFCEQCDVSLKEEAGVKLALLFTEQATDARSRRLLWSMVGMLALIPLVSAAMIWLGVQNGWWGGWAFSLLE